MEHEMSRYFVPILLSALTHRRQSPVEILAETEDKFIALVVDAQIRFEKGADGKVSQLVILQGGRETPAKRDR